MQQLQLLSIGGIVTGGTTKPVNIIALNEEKTPSKYIMKVFTEKNILQNVSVAKEILCSESGLQIRHTKILDNFMIFKKKQRKINCVTI